MPDTGSLAGTGASWLTAGTDKTMLHRLEAGPEVYFDLVATSRTYVHVERWLDETVR
jgi:hypothetical protein